MPELIGIYHSLPYPLRVLIASARGYQLRHWRYGRDTEKLISEYMERETWQGEQWRAWQKEKLSTLLYRAARQVPYYREQWSLRRRQGDRSSIEVLENWPVLSKDTVRAHPKQFVAEDCDIRQMYHEHTSGTTGKSLDLWWSYRTVRNWYALFELRWRRWYGVSRHDRWAILGGQLVSKVNRRRPPFWVWNAGLNQLYMSSYHLAPDLISAYLDALKENHIVYIWGYPSSIYMLAAEALRQERTDLRMKVVITNAEPLYDYQREAIEAAFQCPVRETYGMAEIVSAASECQHGQMHLWPEVGIVEGNHSSESSSANAAGELICTGLFNMDMPLVRYAVGDRSRVMTADRMCSCGRSLPVLDKLQGRVDDILFTRDGRRIGRLDPVFKANLPVIEAQIIQESLDKIVVRFVPAPAYQARDGQTIAKRLMDRMGDVQVILEPVEKLPVDKSGKFRAVVSLLAGSSGPSE